MDNDFVHLKLLEINIFDVNKPLSNFRTSRYTFLFLPDNSMKLFDYHVYDRYPRCLQFLV